MISTLIVAPISSAQIIASSGVQKGADAANAGGLDSAAFLSLHSSALGVPWEPLLPAYDPVAQGSRNGPWVFAIPDVVRDHLSQLSERQSNVLAQSWAQCQELQDDEVSSDDAEEILSKTTQLAKIAKTRNVSLLLWLSP
jgi:hypothetical protein